METTYVNLNRTARTEGGTEVLPIVTINSEGVRKAHRIVVNLSGDSGPMTPGGTSSSRTYDGTSTGITGYITARTRIGESTHRSRGTGRPITARSQPPRLWPRITGGIPEHLDTIKPVHVECHTVERPLAERVISCGFETPGSIDADRIFPGFRFDTSAYVEDYFENHAGYSNVSFCSMSPRTTPVETPRDFSSGFSSLSTVPSWNPNDLRDYQPSEVPSEFCYQGHGPVVLPTGRGHPTVFEKRQRGPCWLLCG